MSQTGYTFTAHRTSAGTGNAASIKLLQSDYRKLQTEPLEGFTVKLEDESNPYRWSVGIFGPPDTLYAGGYFKAIMEFPTDYPYSPPTVRFLTKMWHPNIYPNGRVCISILHPPTHDPLSGELPNERWNPTQTVRTILLSIISLLNEPNISSPANVDASVMYRRYKEENDPEYANITRRLVEESRVVAEREGIRIPQTIEEYIAPSRDAAESNPSGRSTPPSAGSLDFDNTPPSADSLNYDYGDGQNSNNVSGNLTQL